MAMASSWGAMLLAALLVNLVRHHDAAQVVDLLPARTHTALRRVSPHYISFALDNAFVRDPTGTSGVPLPRGSTFKTGS